MTPIVGVARLLTRAAAVVGLVVGVTVASASPAEAHSAGDTPASNYVSRVLSVEPDSRTFSAEVIEAGNRIEVKWKSGPEILIEDYDGYPYLRVGADGAFENRQSNAVYLNADRQGGTQVPEGLNPEGPPEWRRVSSSPVVRFHDHRIHWMGTSPPPQVQRARNREHEIQQWKIPLRQGDDEFVISGDLRWKPGPSPLPMLLGSAVLGTVLAGGVAAAARQGRHRRAIAAFGAMLLALVVVDAVHLFGIAFGVRGGSGLGRVLTIGWISIVAWAISLVTLGALRRNRTDALYVGVFAAGIITLVGGLSDIAVLSSSSVPFAFANTVARLAISLTLGVGIATVVSGVVLTGIVGSGSRPAPIDDEPGSPVSETR